MLTYLLSKPDGNRVAYLHGDVFIGPEKLVFVGKRLYGSSFAQRYCSVLLRVPVSAVGYTVAMPREGRRGAIPAHSSINVGVAFVVTYVTLQSQVFRPCPPVPTVMRGSGADVPGSIS